MSYDFLIFRTYTNPVVRLVRIQTGKVFDDVNQVMSFAPTWADTAKALSKDTNIGGIPVKLSENMDGGEYDALFYDSASPASSDVVDFGLRLHWTGKQLLGLPIAL